MPLSFSEKIIIGKKEKIEFPDLKRKNIVARIDTGAKLSSAHCDKIWLETMKGKKILCCHFLKRSTKVIRFNKFKRVVIKNSHGKQVRYVVKLKVKLHTFTKETSVTLTDRSTMNYSVLLGRSYLSGPFLVDVSKNYLKSQTITR
jgi:hypothetical protein